MAGKISELAAASAMDGTEKVEMLQGGVNVAGLISAIVTLARVGYAPLASPTLTGTPLTPTAAGGTNTTQIASTAFVAAGFQPLHVILTALAALTTSPVVEEGPFSWPTPADGTYTLNAKARVKSVIDGLYGLKLSAGTLTLSVEINGTPVTWTGGGTSIAVTTSVQDKTAASAKTVNVGDAVTLTLSSTSGDAAGLKFTTQRTRS